MSEQPQFASWLPEIYQELHRLAQGALRGQDAHTLQPTALVNEVFLRFAKTPLEISDRREIIALAVRGMRSVLIDHARAKAADKRGAGFARVTLDEDIAQTHDDVDLVALDAALARLEAIDARQALIVEMRYFAGFTIEETAEAAGCSAATVKREAAMALAWLQCELHDDER
ncbi:MAG TPA: ECF-type sigma factor [Rhodanobacteraceae bacterium]|nr:ECF-type sigma factor [Rhodanobacteraceae bacterium]